MSSTIQGVLAKLNISQFSNTREDDSITAEVKAIHQLQGKAGKWVKIKLPEEFLAGVKKAAGAARQAHYDASLHWEEGYRLLPMTAKPRYDAAVAAAKVKFDAEVEKFVESYPLALEKARTMHAGTYRENDYPTLDKVRQQFEFRVAFLPIPSSSHFDVSVVGPAVAAMRAQLEASNSAKVEQAVGELWSRLLDPVTKMADTLRDPAAIFRDSLVGNVIQVLDLVPALNVTGSDQLKTAAIEVRNRLANLNPDVLRNNRVARRAAAETAGEIANRFGRFGGRKMAA